MMMSKPKAAFFKLLFATTFLWSCSQTGELQISNSPDSDSEIGDSERIVLRGTIEATNATLTLPTQPITVAILQIDFDEQEDGATWVSTEIGVLTSGAGLDYEFELPAEGPGDVDFAVNESGDSTVTLLLGAFVDTNENGQRNVNEALVGVAEPFLLYVESVGDSGTEVGVSLGWNTLFLHLDTSGEPISSANPFANNEAVVDFGPNLIIPEPSTALGFQCSDNPTTEDALQVDLFATLAFEQWNLPTPTLSSAGLLGSNNMFHGSFQHPLPSPPVEHYSALDSEAPISPIYMATYVGLVYQDRNANLAYDALTDDYVGISETEEGSQFIARFVPTSFSAHPFIHLLEFPIGWTILQGTDSDEDMTVIDWDEGLSLDCSG